MTDKILNFINGKFVEPRGGRFFENVNPAVGEPYGLIPDSGAIDVEAAVAAARGAFPAWSRISSQERAEYLRRLARAIDDESEKLARAESVDNGKPVALARSVDIPRARLNFEFFADYVEELKGEIFKTENRAVNRTVYSPLGVVGCISPWNLPLYLLTWKVAPALAAGCTVVAKPSEVTPMTAYLLSRLASQIGLPDGVLNVVHGTGPNVGTPLVTHPEVKAISFTGSTATGRAIAQNAAPTFKRLALEMGGKNPNIIFNDYDFDRALDTTVRSSFSNQGQICLCGSRIFIEKGLYPKFRDALVERARMLKIGDPLDEKTEQGALVSEAHMKKVLSYLEIAKREGRVLTGGQRAVLKGRNAGGYFVEPTLIENIPAQHKINTEEIFGPVATLIPFESEDEAIAMANGTKYGLSASVWTRDVPRAERIAARLEAGTIWVNTWMLRDLRVPFGGVKESGHGREGGLEALKFFSEVKNVCIATGP